MERVWWLTKHGPLTDTDSLRTYLQYTDCITKYGPIIQGSLDKPKFNCDEDVVSLYDNASGTYISSAAEMVIANMVFSTMQNLC